MSFSLSALKKALFTKGGYKSETPSPARQLTKTELVGAALLPIAPFAVLPSLLKGAVVGAAKLAGKAVTKVFSKYPIAAPVGSIALTGAVIQKPSFAYTAPADVINFIADTGAVIADPSKETFKELVTESPVLSATTAALIAAAAVKGSGGLIGGLATKGALDDLTSAVSNLEKEKPEKERKEEKVLQTDTSLPTSAGGGAPTPPAVPLTPETQVIGKEVKSGRKLTKFKKKKQGLLQRQSLRVNIFNQNIGKSLIRRGYY